MNTRDKYERALSRLDSHRKKYRSGGPASAEKAYASLYREMEIYRNKLIEEGDWDGPIPIPVRKKYRA